MCACVWQEGGPVVFSLALHLLLTYKCSFSYLQQHCAVSLIALTGINTSTVQTFAVPWLYKMGHVSKCINTCELVSLIAPSSRVLLWNSCFLARLRSTCLHLPLGSPSFPRVDHDTLTELKQQYIGHKIVFDAVCLCFHVWMWPLLVWMRPQWEWSLIMKWNHRNIDKMPL